MNYPALARKPVEFQDQQTQILCRHRIQSTLFVQKCRAKQRVIIQKLGKDLDEHDRDRLHERLQIVKARLLGLHSC